MGGTMLSKSLIQFSVDRQCCVPSLLFGLRPNYGGGNEDNSDLLQKVPAYTAALSAPTLQQATTDPCLCRRLTGKSESVSCEVTAPFSWVLVHTRFFLCLLIRVCFPVQCKFWQFYGGLMTTSSRRPYSLSRSAVPRAPAPAAGHC